MVDGGAFLGGNKYNCRHPDRRYAPPDDRLRRVIQYSGKIIILDGGDYWIPAFAGMAAVVFGAFSLNRDPASSPYDVLTVWMPHSVFGLPRQRPAPGSSPGPGPLGPGTPPAPTQPFSLTR